MTQETEQENIHIVCGDCKQFKPKEGDRFFNCTKAFHSGFKYGAQVRADSRSCDAFESK